MKKQVLGTLLLGLLALASSAGAQVWTAVGSAGAVDNDSIAAYGTNDGALFILNGISTVWAIYDVTNPRDSSGSPSWSTFEFTARRPTAGGIGVYATATLYRQPRFSATAIAVCTAIAPATGTVSTSTCTFSPFTFDFANNYYFVRVALGRETTSQNVAAYGLRVF